MYDLAISLVITHKPKKFDVVHQTISCREARVDGAQG